MDLWNQTAVTAVTAVSSFWIVLHMKLEYIHIKQDFQYKYYLWYLDISSFLNPIYYIVLYYNLLFLYRDLYSESCVFL